MRDRGLRFFGVSASLRASKDRRFSVDASGSGSAYCGDEVLRA